MNPRDPHHPGRTPYIPLGETDTHHSHPTNPPASDANKAPTASYVPTAVPAFIGRYEIQQVLGRGGMGEVYLARDPELDRLVALKVPVLSGAKAEERFLREARAAAALNHPNLCPVYDAGRADGVPYLAMAYVPGLTLAQTLRRGRLAPPRAAVIAAAVARGMAEAHRHDIVHRDLKPGNILLDARGNPVVTDFGLALRDGTPAGPSVAVPVDPGDSRLTRAGAVLGTPAYMSPEQASGRLDRVRSASDIYSLGAVLFEMLTGRPPFEAQDVETLLTVIRTEPPPRPSAEAPGVPPGLDAVCLKALAKQPAERFASMDAFAEALAPFAARPHTRRARYALAAAAVVLVVLAAAAVWYVRTDRPAAEFHPRKSDSAEPKEPPAKRPPPAPAAVWNAELKGALEGAFPAGVDKGIGRYMYGELDTALETLTDGEWKVGPGMTRDRRPVAFKVVEGRLSVVRPTAAEMAGWKLDPLVVDRKTSATFAHRRLDLMRLKADGNVVFSPRPNGEVEVAVPFRSEVAYDRSIDSVNLIVQVVTRVGKDFEGTTEIHHQPEWTRPPAGRREVRFTTGRGARDFPAGFTARVRVEAFVTEPRAGRYRVSDDLVVPAVVRE